MTISAVVLTKNSAKTLEKCLNSLSWCNEIVVIDDNSTDTSVSIARKHKATVFIHALENDFSQQRNFGLEKAVGDWVLFVDSDEVISPSLRSEIELRIKNYELGIQGYYIKRIDHMWGKKLQHGEMGDMWLLRLARKNAGKWEGTVHETWEIKGTRGKLRHVIEHYPHPTVSEFLSEINFYSTLRAEALKKQGVQVHFLDIILYPKAKFIYNFVIKRGFLDGIEGFMVAIFMSFHSFLVRGKLWQMQEK